MVPDKGKLYINARYTKRVSFRANTRYLTVNANKEVFNSLKDIPYKVYSNNVLK